MSIDQGNAVQAASWAADRERVRELESRLTTAEASLKEAKVENNSLLNVAAARVAKLESDLDAALDRERVKDAALRTALPYMPRRAADCTDPDCAVCNNRDQDRAEVEAAVAPPDMLQGCAEYSTPPDSKEGE